MKLKLRTGTGLSRAEMIMRQQKEREESQRLRKEMKRKEEEERRIAAAKKEELARRIHSTARGEVARGRPEFPVLEWVGEEPCRPCLATLVTKNSWLIFDRLGLMGSHSPMLRSTRRMPSTPWPSQRT